MSEQNGPQTFDLSSFSEADLHRLAENTQRQLETIRKSKRDIPQNDKLLESVIAAIQKASTQHDVFPRSVIAAACKKFNVGISISESVSIDEFNAAKLLDTEPTQDEKPPEDTVTEQEEKTNDTAEAISPTRPRTPPAKTATKKRRTTTRSKTSAKSTAKTNEPRVEGKVSLKAPVNRSREPEKPARTKGSPVITSKSSRLIPKFTHPENDEMTWSGAGKKPRWVIACLEAGMTLEQLRTK